MKKSNVFTRKSLSTLTLIICAFAPVFSANPVRAQNGPVLAEGIRFVFAPFWDALIGMGQPYVAGFMTTDYLSGSPGGGDASAVRVTVSFAGTYKSVIQTDNCLAAGIAAQGPDTREWNPITGVPVIDWGYLLLLVLDGGQNDPYIQGMVWKCYEWGRNGRYPLEYPTADLASNWTWRYPGILTVNSQVTLKMVWNSTYLKYFATIGGVEYALYSYTPESEELRYFKLGTVGRECGPIPLPETVKWFQFAGAWSYYEIGKTGWLSHLSDPSFVRTNETTWRSVRFAYSVHGIIAYMDHTMVWGANPYFHVGAHYPLEPYGIGFGHVIFYPTSDDSTIPAYTLLWDPTCDGGGACPFVYTWDGQRYVIDNNILPASEMSNGSDVDDYYRLEQKLIPTYRGTAFSLYSLQIREFEHEHDYIDQVKLFAVDHCSDVNVAVTPHGEILTYMNPIPPISATDNEGTDILSLLSSIDGNYYQGYNGSYITMTFAPTNISDGVKLVIRADERPPLLKCPVCVQVLNATDEWNTVAIFHTRTYWATDIINMRGYLPDADGNLKVRLRFISTEKIDYIGLDITPQANIEIYEAYLTSALHSKRGNVRQLLTKTDQAYAELIPSEQIQLTFQLPNNQNEKRTLIFYANGHYNTIP